MIVNWEIRYCNETNKCT